jgi:GGDEF domain-containing protein
VAGERVPLTISIGGTVAAPGDSAASLVRRADGQLYAAKHAGRNQAIVGN